MAPFQKHQLWWSPHWKPVQHQNRQARHMVVSLSFSSPPPPPSSTQPHRLNTCSRASYHSSPPSSSSSPSPPRPLPLPPAFFPNPRPGMPPSPESSSSSSSVSVFPRWVRASRSVMAVITITGSPTKPFFFFFPIVFPRWPGDRTSDAKGVALPPPPLPPPPLLATFGVVVIPNCLRDAAMCHGSSSLLLLLVSPPLPPLDLPVSPLSQRSVLCVA